MNVLLIWDESQGKYVPIPAVKGDKGDPGADGHTPEKGVDYWTAADKAEMVAAVLAALPDGTEVAY